MKNTNLNLKALTKYIGIVGVMLVAFSCAKNNNNDNLQQGVVFQNCATCGSIVNGQTIFQSQSTDNYYGISLNLNFIGTGYNQYNQYNQYPYTQTQQYPYNQYPNAQQYPYNQYPNTGYSPVISYSGAIGAQGQLQISQTISNGYYYGGCTIPAGTYSLDTVQAGQWNQAIVSGLVLQAYGPVQMVVAIPQAQVSAKSQLGQTWNEVAPVGRLFGNLVIQSVNGMNCQISTLVQ